jgi:(S)-3,5-dihydroxyphenylglycine transaminase
MSGAVGSVAAPGIAELEQEWLPPRASDLRGTDLRGADLHGSVHDPVLDTMNFLNEITLRYPDAISFAPGRPYDGFFETEDIIAHIRRYLDYLSETGNTPGQIRDSLFQYGPTAGQIRELIAASLRQDENIVVPPESIVITVGCQEAMFLVLRALISGPQDALLVSSPCYVGISGAARLLDIPVIAVEEGKDGFRCSDLDDAILAAKACGRRPRMFYIVPDHSNPSGNTISLETRRALLELAARHDILILEDSPYRLVSPGSQLPTLKCLDRERRVIHLGSFSKTAFPGARLGFVVADQIVADRAGDGRLLAGELAKIKSMITVNTSPLSQAAVAGMLLASGGRLSELNRETASYYGRTMQATLEELDRHFGGDSGAGLGVHWNRPSGGFFLTLQVPFPADNAALTRSAEEFGVIWTPMSYFYPGGGGEHSIRLSTSYLSHPDIVTGISRLARFISAEARRDLLFQKGETRHVPHSALYAQHASPVGLDIPMTANSEMIGVAMSMTIDMVQVSDEHAGAADLVIWVDGRQPPSSEAIADIDAACCAAEDRDEYGRVIVHVSGTPRRSWAGELTLARVSRWERALRRLERLPVTTIGVASGDCGGIALDALLATDYRIGTPSVQLLLPVEAGAIWPGLALYRLVQQAGAAAVRRTVLLGAPIGGPSALALNLIDELTDNIAIAVEAVPSVSGPEIAIRRRLMLDAGVVEFDDAFGAHLAACDRILRRRPMREVS